MELPDNQPIRLTAKEMSEAINLGTLLTVEQSDRIGTRVKDGYLADKESRKEWERRNRDANELALQVVKTKSTPWQGASNVKFPLLTVATLQFAARAYGALLKGPDIVKCRVTGADPTGAKKARATRVASHLSWQVLEQDENWEEEHDRLLMTVPIVGCSFMKSWYDPVKGHNCSQHVLANDLVIDYYARSVKDSERKTHVFSLFPREIRERQLAGLYTDVDLDAPPTPTDRLPDNRQGLTAPFWEKDASRQLLECHCYLDLDGDKYDEPYVATVDEQSGKLLRLVNRFGAVVTEQTEKIKKLQKLLPDVRSEDEFFQIQTAIQQLSQEEPIVLRIEAVESFVKYPFIPAPDGGIYDLGFGSLLGPINESVNTIINQLIDSGTLQNGSGGFIGRGARIPGGEMRFKPYEWKRVDVAGATLRDSIVPLPVAQPSAVLFQLLGTLVAYGEKIASVTDAMTGENVGQNTPAYNMQSMVTQGMAVFTGIFKRMFRSMRDEYRQLYALNARHLTPEEYFQVVDGPVQEVYLTDYRGDPTDIVPAADPNAVLSEEKQRQAGVLAARSAAVPGYNMAVVEQRILEASGIQDVQEIFPVDPQTGQPVIPPPQNPEIEMKREEERRRVLEAQDRARATQADLQIKGAVAEAQIELVQAQVIKTYAEAGAIDVELMMKKMELSLAQLDMKRQVMKDVVDGQAKLNKPEAKAKD
jgi:chaperonin GroES